MSQGRVGDIKNILSPELKTATYYKTIPLGFRFTLSYCHFVKSKEKCTF